MTPQPIDDADWLPGFLVSSHWTWGSVTLENADMKELFGAATVYAVMIKHRSPQ
jgi:hypothetical protein